MIDFYERTCINAYSVRLRVLRCMSTIIMLYININAIVSLNLLYTTAFSLYQNCMIASSKQ